MISYLSKIMALFLIRKKVVQQEDYEIYQYGFEIIVATVIGFLLVLGIGLLLQETLLALLFYVLFVGVRLFCGGYHAETHLKCKLTLAVCCTITLLAAKYVPAEKIWVLPIHAFLLLSYLATIFIFSPMTNEKMPLTEKEIKRNRKVSIILAVVLSGLSIFASLYFVSISITASMTLFMVAILILIPKMNERRKKTDEKDDESGAEGKCKD